MSQLHLKGPFAPDSRLGWIIFGPVGGNPSVLSLPMNFVQAHAIRVDAEQITLEKQHSKFLVFPSGEFSA